MHIEATPTFIKLYKKLSPNLKKKVKKTLTIFQENPSHPSLGHKKMAGQNNIFEIRVTRNYRITYSKIGDTAILPKVGTHDVLTQIERFLSQYVVPTRHWSDNQVGGLACRNYHCSVAPFIRSP